MLDFTPEKYTQLIETLIQQGAAYEMMHDVDARPEASLILANIEAHLGIKGTYYFRSKHFISHKTIIEKVHQSGHAIGYHYEDMALSHGDTRLAYTLFIQHLEQLRNIAPVDKACAHGSPLSRWNNQDLWKQYDIHSLGIKYEPLLDTNFHHTLYLTDTGRQWDGYRSAVRDKIPSLQEEWSKNGLSFHTTDDIVHALNNFEHPIHQKTLLINTHPQRWMPFGVLWVEEAIVQWWKNKAKWVIVKSSKK